MGCSVCARCVRGANNPLSVRHVCMESSNATYAPLQSGEMRKIVNL